MEAPQADQQCKLFKRIGAVIKARVLFVSRCGQMGRDMAKLFFDAVIRGQFRKARQGGARSLQHQIALYGIGCINARPLRIANPLRELRQRARTKSNRMQKIKRGVGRVWQRRNRRAQSGKSGGKRRVAGGHDVSDFCLQRGFEPMQWQRRGHGASSRTIALRSVRMATRFLPSKSFSTLSTCCVSHPMAAAMRDGAMP